jgi:hypothetical protein
VSAKLTQGKLEDETFTSNLADLAIALDATAAGTKPEVFLMSQMRLFPRVAL